MAGVCAYTRTLSALSAAGGVTKPGSPRHVFVHEVYVLCIAGNSLLFPYRSKISDHQMSHAHLTDSNTLPDFSERPGASRSKRKALAP